jgi:hypothetical protein
MSRTMMWVLGAIFAVVLAICITGAVLALATDDADVDVNLGDDEFEIEDIASLADQAPLAFADPTGGSRPLLIQHLGDEPEEDWVALLAVAPGTEACAVNWDPDEEQFEDCEGQTYPADGTGLTPFPTRVEDGTLYVDLGRGRDDSDDPVVTGD